MKLKVEERVVDPFPTLASGGGNVAIPAGANFLPGGGGGWVTGVWAERALGRY